jgi:hypothetical protein
MSNQARLAGVTSSLLHELFQIALDNASAITGQSARFSGTIEAATALAKEFVPAIVTLEIPSSDVRDEVCGVLRGLGDGGPGLQTPATNDSVLAKNLGITAEMIEQWKADGRLVDEMIKRLQMQSGEILR